MYVVSWAVAGFIAGIPLAIALIMGVGGVVLTANTLVSWIIIELLTIGVFAAIGLARNKTHTPGSIL